MEKGGENLSLGQTSSAVRRRKRRTVLGGSGGVSPPAIDPRGFFPPSLFSSGREEKEREFFAQAEKWVEKRSGGKKERGKGRELFYLEGRETGGWDNPM